MPTAWSLKFFLSLKYSHRVQQSSIAAVLAGFELAKKELKIICLTILVRIFDQNAKDLSIVIFES